MPDPKALSDVDGMIVIGWHSETEVDWIRSLGRNVVFADFHPQGDDLDSVHCDLEAATFKLLAALEGLGYRRIAFIGWIDRHSQEPIPQPETRGVAFRRWAEARNLFDPAMFVLGKNSEAAGFELAGQLLDRPQRPEIIVTGTDNIAVGVYRAIHKRGLRIPKDVAVASFNDISAAQFLHPPLTTVHLPAEAIGENAVNLLIERIQKRELAKTLRLETKIVWRESTRRPDES
jgi:LacI family transcriptional regulator